MSRSKSCEDIRIHIRHSSGATDVNSNVIVTNLMKKGPTQKIYSQDEPDAYIQALQQKFQNVENQKMIKCYQYASPRSTQRIQKSLNQQQVDRLISIQDQLKVLAFQTICSRAPFKSRTPLRITAKQLKQTDMKTIGARMKRTQLTKKVMANATQNIKKIKKQKNKTMGSSIQSSQSSQSISGRTFQTFKSSFQKQSKQQKQARIQKQNYFNGLIDKNCYQKIYNIQRRKQAWKAYLQAQRNKVIMQKNKNHNKAYITFVNDSSNNLKKVSKIRRCNSVQEDYDNYLDTLKMFKQFNQDFQNFSASYKLKEKQRQK